jgi:hypothetical protein
MTTERERFEAWLIDAYGPNHGWTFNEITCGFEAWQAALSAPPGWQPIETAPRDQTAVLVMRNIWPGTDSGFAEECNGHNTYVAEWWQDSGGCGEWVCYMDAILDPRCPIEPTHWMPLPDAPKEPT